MLSGPARPPYASLESLAERIASVGFETQEELDLWEGDDYIDAEKLAEAAEAVLDALREEF